MTRRLAVAILGLPLAICVGIGDAAARGRYSNFGPWSNDHSQVLPRDISDAAFQRVQACGYVLSARTLVLLPWIRPVRAGSVQSARFHARRLTPGAQCGP